MKKIILFLFAWQATCQVNAQRCFTISTAAAPDLIQKPVSAAASFKDCHTREIEHGVLEIVDFGKNVTDLDTLMARQAMAFSVASVSGNRTQVPSATDVNAAKNLAETLNGMTDDQKKEFAMQMAKQQMQSARQAPAIQDDAATIQLIMQTRDIAAQQLKAVNDEFRGKLQEIRAAQDRELKELEEPDPQKCPAATKDGMPSCKCENKMYLSYWKQEVEIQEKYNRKKLDLLNSYTPKIRLLCNQVDNNIKKLKYGDAVKSPQMKHQLFSCQSSAFANAADLTVSCAEDIRKTGAQLYLNQVNSERNAYYISCAL
jgi:hypothetical protein